MRALLFALGGLILNFCLSLLAAAEETTLNEAMNAIAKEVAGRIKVLDQQAGIAQHTISVGAFTAAAPLGGGPRIAQDLAAAIGLLDVRVAGNARFSITGRLSRGK